MDGESAVKGLGIDLCGVDRIRQAMEQTPGFLTRYYTEQERAYLQSRGKAAPQSAAAMFAAKEAFLKAVCTGLGEGIAFQDIDIVHLESGAPQYRLTGAALEKARQLQVKSLWLSLTHENGMAAAVCVLDE